MSSLPPAGATTGEDAGATWRLKGLAWFTFRVYNAGMIRRVELSRLAQRQLRRVPAHIARKLLGWVESVEHDGLEEVRKIPGFHDEPLQGDRQGQRSIRLSLAYRAIYEIRKDDLAELVSVEEVSKHDY